MKTKNSVFLSISLVALAAFFLLPGLVSANRNSTFYIQGSGGSVLVNTSLTIPETCTVQDSAGISHSFSGHNAVCAIQAAKDTNLISSFEFKDFGGSLGLFLDSLNGIASGSAPDYPYWNLWKNGIFSDVGIEGITLSAGDNFQLTYGPWITGIVSIPQDTPSLQPSGGGVPTPAHYMLNVKTAISFLLPLQNKDGSFGTVPLLSDWTALALSSYSSSETERAKDALKNHLLGDPSAGTLLTDYERRAMALMALGINPYFGTPTNYVQKIIDGFDGEQFGDSNLINDDIFALLALVKAGYQSSDIEITKTIAFILGRQESNDSFGSVDMTAAAIQALALVSGAEGVSDFLAGAREYLKKQQKDSGGFGNVYATSWAMQAIATLGESEVSWIKNEHTPGDYLYFKQAEDGGIEKEDTNNNRIWAISYAIPAALGKDWGKMLSAFPKPQEEVSLPLETRQNNLSPIVAEQIQEELTRVSQETAVLTLQVTSFVLESVVQQTAVLRSRVLAFVESQQRALALESQVPEEIAVTAESFPSSPLSASVGEATKAQLPWQNLVPYIVGGGVLMFLLFGNPKVLLNLVKQLKLLN